MMMEQGDTGQDNAAIKFLILEGVPSSEIYQQLSAVLNKNALIIRRV
jgi:hypothetical protein